jgi:hypothetical protein
MCLRSRTTGQDFTPIDTLVICFAARHSSGCSSRYACAISTKTSSGKQSGAAAPIPLVTPASRTQLPVTTLRPPALASAHAAMMRTTPAPLQPAKVPRARASDRHQRVNRHDRHHPSDPMFQLRHRCRPLQKPEPSSRPRRPRSRQHPIALGRAPRPSTLTQSCDAQRRASPSASKTHKPPYDSSRMSPPNISSS